MGLAVVLWTTMMMLGRAGAWGIDGHRATCLVAESLMEPATVKAVRMLLPEYANGSLASVCSWADDVAHTDEYRATSALHFINTPDFLCQYDYDRDCHDNYGHKGWCASGAIKTFTSQLTKFQNPSALAIPPRRTKALETTYNLTEALLFLAHIVGDIHQPLHVAFTSDLGGNTVIVDWYGAKENLHFIWDVEIIERARDLYYNRSVDTMAASIMHTLTNKWTHQAQLWSECSNEEIACPDKFATEGISLSCKWAYRNATPGSTLGDEYFLSRLPIVERRLAQGGVRLAAILNHLFSTNGTS